MSKTNARRQLRWRQQRARRVGIERDAAMTRFDRLVGIVILLETAVLLWIAGVIRPL